MRIPRGISSDAQNLSILPYLSEPVKETTISLSVPTERLQMLMLAAETLGRPVEELLREAVELCVDTSVALAVHRAGYQ